MKNYEELMATLTAEAEKENLTDAECQDLRAIASDLHKLVSAFTSNAGIANETENGCVAVESFNGDALSQLGASSMIELAKSAGIPDANLTEATLQLGLILAKAAGGKSANVWSRHNMIQTGSGMIQLSDVLPDSVIAGLGTKIGVDTEAFDPSHTDAAVDLNATMVVSLMKWHTGITSRMLSVVTNAQSTVVIKRTHRTVYDLSTDGEEARMVDMYRDPSMIKNSLKTIKVLLANANGELVADDIIKFGADADILKLSIDSSKEGYGQINRTDTVSDGASVASVQVQIADGVDTEVFEFAIPSHTGKLSVVPGDMSKRGVQFAYAGRIAQTTTLASGGASAIAAKIGDAADYIDVKIVASVSVVLRTGATESAFSAGAIVTGNTAGAATAAATDTLAGNFVVVGVGYTLDAKFSENNMRKASTAMTVLGSEDRFAIPNGKRFIVDYQFNDGTADAPTNAANLGGLIRVGHDAVVMDFIIDTLTQINKESAAASTMSEYRALGAKYAAGDAVNPYVVAAVLDLSSITSVTDADRAGEIRARVLGFLGSVISEIHAKSFFTQQLNGKPPVYRLLTNNQVLANVLGQPHTHNHLNVQRDSGNSGVEYTLVLPGGVSLEVVTTTFESLGDRMLILPIMIGQPKSELNYGINYDNGTMAGDFTYSSGNGSNRRLYASTRELPLVSNAIGAVVDITGIDIATFRTTP